MRRRGYLAVAALTGGCTLFTPLGEGEFSGGDVPNDAAVDVDDRGDVDASREAEEDASVPVDADAAPPAGSRYRAAVLADGPILYVRLSDPVGLTAKAEVGPDGTYDPTGVLNGVSGALAGDPDRAISLTDGTGRVAFPESFASFSGKASFSVEVWARAAALNTDVGFVVDHAEYVDGRDGWSLRVTSGGAVLERWADSMPNSVGAPITSGGWHHIVATVDPTTIRIYVDGALGGSGAVTHSIPTRASELTIGHQSCRPCATNSFVGEVDEVAVYDKVLLAQQVAAHYTAGK